MPRLDLAAYGQPPKRFPREFDALTEMLEDGINAAWAGAGTDTPAIRDAVRALLVLRQMTEPMEVIQRVYRQCIAAKDDSEDSQHLDVILDALRQAGFGPQR